MAVGQQFFLEQLYPLQDRVLAVISALDTGFYLTGGTALSRGYLYHRFSDDLDLFVNDDPSFERWGARIIQGLTEQPAWHSEVNQRDEQFIRLSLRHEDISLRIDLVNDVSARVGDIQAHPQLGRLDSIENIFANKLTAVTGRSDPKDLADIWAITQNLGLSVTGAITDAQSKAAGIFPVTLARAFLSIEPADWEHILWRNPPSLERFISDLKALGEGLLLDST